MGYEAEVRTGAKVTIGFVASFGSVQGLPKHFDTEDLIVIQVAGSKVWSFDGEPVAGSGVKRPELTAPDGARQTIRLDAGDILLVPSGQFHECEPVGDSLHVGVLIQRPMVADLVQELRRRIRLDPELTRPLRRVPDGAERTQWEALVKDRLCNVIRSADLAQLLEEQYAAERRSPKFDAGSE